MSIYTWFSSIIVDYLSTHFSDESTSTACVYLSHQNQNVQTPTNLLASVLKQIIQQEHNTPDSLQRLYQSRSPKSTRPSLDGIASILREASDRFERIFVVVDALDEYDDSDGSREMFLAELQSLGKINILVTARPHVCIENPLKPLASLEVRAVDDDLGNYVKGRLKQHSRLAKHVKEHANLLEDIIRTIVDNAHGM